LLFVEPFFLFVLLPAAVYAFYISGFYLGQTAALSVILAVSAIFYAPYGVLPATLLATSLFLNLIIGMTLSRGRHELQCRRKTLLTVGLVLNFSALGMFKYLDPLAALIAPSPSPILGVGVPAGISFYTFHQAVFLLHAYDRHPEVIGFLDAVHGRFDKLKTSIRYAAFVAFFPQLVIGPITYLSEFAPQLQRPGFGRLRIVDLQVGMTLIAVGLFKKLCIADVLGGGVNTIDRYLSGGLLIPQTDAAFFIVGYFFQLYFDFSGYSDIALGIARLFGLRLPINFDSPLRATGIVDFYRRWHITLTRVIAVFVFTPLSLVGTRIAVERGYKGWRRRALGSWLPFLANFQLIALWHGVSGTFVLFGISHAVWYIIETEFTASRKLKSLRTRTSDRFRAIAGMAITAAPLMLTFALFRSDSLSSFWRLLSRLVAFGTVGATTPPTSRWNWVIVVLVAAMVYLLPNVYEILRRYRPGIVTYANPSMTPALLRVAWRPNLQWGLFVAGLALIVFTRLNRPTVFLYEGF
jgi:alginate O-acetyltransferase complex protein AlgI